MIFRTSISVTAHSFAFENISNKKMKVITMKTILTYALEAMSKLLGSFQNGGADKSEYHHGIQKGNLVFIVEF